MLFQIFKKRSFPLASITNFLLCLQILQNIGQYMQKEVLFHLQSCFDVSVSALKVIQESTGINFGWEDDPCSPMPWDHLKCEGNSVTAL